MGGDSSLNIVVRLKDEASKALAGLQTRVNTFATKMEMPIAAAKKLAGALTVAGTAMGGFGLMAVKSAANMEQTMISFETMLGSAEKAKAFYKDLVSFAAKTPFNLAGLETASKQLLAYGFAQEEVLPNLKALGDMASGVGMDKLPNLILAFGQVKAATKLTGMELRQFTEAGVPLLDELSKIMKKPVAEIQEMVSAGAIGFPIVEQALKNLTGEGGRFNNLMEKQSKSLAGMWSNLGDAWEQFLRGEGAMLLDFAKALVAGLTDLVQNKLPLWIQHTKEVVKWLRELPAVINENTGLITLFSWAWKQIGDTFTTYLLPALKQLWEALKPLEPTFTLLAKILGGVLLAAIYAAVAAVTGWVQILTVLIALSTKVATYILTNFVKPIQDFVKEVKSAIEWVGRLIEKMTGLNVKNVGSKMLKGVKGILGFEHGGVVPGPVGMPVPILAHGQERILPAGKSAGGGSYAVNIYNPVVRNESDLSAIKEQINDALRGLMRDHKLSAI